VCRRRFQIKQNKGEKEGEEGNLEQARPPQRAGEKKNHKEAGFRHGPMRTGGFKRGSVISNTIRGIVVHCRRPTSRKTAISLPWQLSKASSRPSKTKSEFSPFCRAREA